MPALIVTAVDNATDQLTIAGHGLLTGDGPAAVRNIPGMPGGLSPLTDVWIIRVDANTIKLATSSANALLGTAINITSNGSGPTTLLIGIPYRRARTYAASSQVKSADLNSLMDAELGLLRDIAPIHASGFHAHGPVLPTYGSDRWTLPTGTALQRALTAPLSVTPGMTIAEVHFAYQRCNNDSTITYSLVRTPIGGGAEVVVATANDNTASVAWTVGSLTPNHVALAGNFYAVRFERVGGGGATTSEFVGAVPVIQP